MRRSTRGTNTIVLISALLLLIAWQVAAMFMQSSLLLPSPIEAFGTLLGLMGEAVFWKAVWATTLRALKSFLITMAAGLSLGLAAGLIPVIRATAAPIVTVIRTIPVMSVILLAFIWFSSGTVPVFAAILMSFPVLFENTFQGVVQTDKRLLEMGNLYRLTRRQKLLHISVPSLLPFLAAGARGTIGMTWKVVIAAEVLTVPKRGIGSAMQFSQINLETDDVMAWTVAAILLSGLSQVLFSFVSRALARRRLGKGGSLED